MEALHDQHRARDEPERDLHERCEAAAEQLAFLLLVSHPRVHLERAIGIRLTVSIRLWRK